MSLLSYLSEKQHISEHEAIYYLIQIITGYTIYKAEKYNQRDFTIENIIISNKTVKIDDFGLSKHLSDKKSFNIFKSPEEFFENSFIPDKSDVWSLGMIYYYTLFKQFPWKGPNEISFFRLVKLIDLKIPKRIKILNEKNVDLIKKMLEKDHKKRIKWSELLEHELFKEIHEKLKNIPKKTENPRFFKYFPDIFEDKDLLKCLDNIENAKNRENLIKFSEIDYKNVNQKPSLLINFDDENEKTDEITKSNKISIDDLLKKLKSNTKPLEKPQKDDDLNELMDVNTLLTHKPSIPVKSLIESLKESILQSKALIKPYITQQEELEDSIYLSNYPIIQRNDEISIEKDFESLKKIINRKVTQINILGDCAEKIQRLLKGTDNTEFWKIYCFFLQKKMLYFRNKLLFLLNSEKSQFSEVIEQNTWVLFKKTNGFLDLYSKIEEENIALKVYFDGIYEEIRNKLKLFNKNEIDSIKDYINKDMNQNFNRVFFIMLFLYSQTLDKKIKKEKNHAKLCFLMQVNIYIFQCMIISESDMNELIYEDLDVNMSFDIEELTMLLSIQNEHVNILKKVYIK